MPKVVDHEQRRRQIADAMWRVIAREGMAAASARSVAAEGAWSLGAVRYYFTSQDELLRFAIDQMIEGVTARVRHQWRTGSPGEERCRRVLEELLPFDERRTGEVRVWLAALVQSQVDPSLTDLCQAGWRGTRLVCRGVVAEVRGEDRLFAQVVADPDPPLPPKLEKAAELLHTVVDGLTLQASTIPDAVDEREVRRQLSRYVSAVRTGEWSG
ncbi:hypothetical protein BJF80_10755 [Serinicoccus sp. CUA-874]|uniref:TetR/AcrR family transcriptional regulator n=1 Tax=Serinicoccus sp. CUA-874 TaxID=1517939 RepID=UPI000969E956|nr:TetR family transcriptional regulator C-terminal domain-containing protein [Serinicoccus sp. CUA-874]OLT15330.1 hypothetical protein BJF80_10755 [Serinicoccus sp. CUA-874]